MKKNCKKCDCRSALSGAEIIIGGAGSLNNEQGCELVSELKEHLQQIAIFAQDEFGLLTTGAKLMLNFEVEEEDEEGV